ncbi:acylphosphatase [Clostridium moniliforme]|uniref:acylphosphatase n=1 Tax=Clostridium moniliforme TaxID=39489 RepID=A0ABS4F0E8_9CLOT|nr:acylphosphatase [Clostridium moniliforme]MBP1889562.1 acylphosphatase [Clostridium moniliforme]
MNRIEVIFSGRVQGVGFRYFVQINAINYNLTGWVKNLSNGNVLLEVQGNNDTINKFLNIIKKGNGFSKVIDMTITSLPVNLKEKKFKVVY